MTDPSFKPMHVTVRREHCLGNGGLGRFWILPGSRDRAKQIAETYFHDFEVISSPRGHDGYIGKYDGPDGTVVDIGVISTGMGAPSVDIIATEMIKLGAKVLVRVGTAGAMQKTLSIGDIVIATGAIRDEGTTRHYMPLEFPALGSATVVTAMCTAAQRQLESDDDKLEEGAQWVYDAGPVHTKDSLMAREFKYGPYAPEHKRYMEVLEDLGCLASEMEVAMLFSLAQVYGVKAGCVLAIIGGGDDAPISDQAHLKSEAVARSCSIVCQGMAQLKKKLARYGRKASLLGRSLSQTIKPPRGVHPSHPTLFRSFTSESDPRKGRLEGKQKIAFYAIMFSLSYYCWLMADEERRQEFEEAKTSFNLQLTPEQRREQEAVYIAKMVPRWTGEEGTLDSGEKLILLEFNSEDHRWYNLGRIGEFVMRLRDYAERKKSQQEDSNLRDSQLYYTIVQKSPGPVLEMTAHMGDKSERMFIDEGFKVVHGLEEFFAPRKGSSSSR
ncbi:hypothetical protein FOZ62_023849 [Perkinsus olseni]|uniref:Nucleoside phosphorylase domain-containing protein n=2 Tax=Perkinsus olseni TaxID=32597 RepID=A0A7J6R207_PEROL|nr:hypothetical protein FOZ62_023849 [Perkinsus olseni]